MRRILAIARRGIDAAITAFAQTDRTADGLPVLRMITYTPEIPRENRSAGRLPSFSARQEKPDDDFTELTRICDAIGLNVKEVTGESVLHPASPRENQERSHEVSDDVLKLVKHVEAVNGPRPALRPATAEAFEAVRPVALPRASSLTQARSFTDSEMADVLASLKLRLLKIRLPVDDMAEVQAEIATATAQLLSPRPKPKIIALSLTTLLAVLEKAGPAALTKDVEASLTTLRAFLQQ